MTPQQQLADVFVALAGSSTDGSVEGVGEGAGEGVAGGGLDVCRTLGVLAGRTPALLGVRAASVVYVPGGRDEIRVSGSDTDVSLLEREAVSWREGPGHVVSEGVAAWPEAPAALGCGPVMRRWPRYAPRALALDYTHVVSLPLRVSAGSLGALVLFAGRGDVFSPGALRLGQSMADFTAVTLHRAREAEQSRVLAGQLERALASRVVIEQAKGVLAVRRSLSVDDAFDAMRAHARSHRRVLSEVAREVVEGHADPELAG
ncbi:ANTAR domain-containing response regulator [Streptomyces sp. NPDC029674]|uniref:ANTAR domain-containing response regulator n=1 Tax=Streptomyces sp. NPDC029674 TaxID=3365297 RepID=UPI00384DDDF4